MITGEGAPAEALTELTDEQRAFGDFLIGKLELDETILGRTVTFKERTSTIKQGLYDCLDHIKEHNMGLPEIQVYVDGLVALADQQQDNA